MWEPDSRAFVAVKAAELALLSPAVRQDNNQVPRVLSTDFAEIGRWGRRWSYAEMVAALQAEDPREAPETSEWLFNRISPELVLVNYRIHGAPRDSRHTSLWEVPSLVLRFHQGTFIAEV